MRPLYQRLQRQGFNGNGRPDRASLQPLLVSQFGNGRPPTRHSRASLHWLHVRGTPTLFGSSDPTPPRKSKIASEEMKILQRGNEKIFGTSICFFRSFISFFRSFICRFRGEYLFAHWRFPIFSVETVAKVNSLTILQAKLS